MRSFGSSFLSNTPSVADIIPLPIMETSEEGIGMKFGG